MSNLEEVRQKLKKAIGHLDYALKFSDQALKEQIYLDGIVKSYESCLEYAWKYLQQRFFDEGVEVYSPKETFKQAGRAGIIDDVEVWLDFVNHRNLAVHDYLGSSGEDDLSLIRRFKSEVKKLLPPPS